MLAWMETWGLQRYGTKVIGIVAAVITSHAVTILGDPKFADFWKSWGLSPLQIVNKTVFQSKLTVTLTLLWITAEHIWQRVQEQKVAVKVPVSAGDPSKV